jgi:hypothetical protein
VSGNLAHPRFFGFSDKTEILLQNPDGTFTDAQGDWLGEIAPAGPTPSGFVGKAGLRYSETHSVPALGDFDRDGDLDLILTAVYDGRPTDFYWNDGSAHFTLDSFHSGLTTENGWGVALSDWDQDGDLDVFAHEPFENQAVAAGHWFEVRALGGVTANWAAIGATVRVWAGGKTYLRHVQGGTGKGGQDSQYLHFGLGGASEVDAVEIVYPGGAVATFGPFDVDRRVWLSEDGTVFEGAAP